MSTFRDPYIVKWLLQKTESGDIIWQRRESGPYSADFNEGKNRVNVTIGTAIRPPLIYIKLSSLSFGEVQVEEPHRALFSKRYESEDDEEFAKIIKRLLVVATNQHAQNQVKDMENEEERKQAIYRRLLNMD